MLTEHFLKSFRSINPAVTAISVDGLRLLLRYPFPGNVRELENIIERAMILANGTELTPQNLLVGTTPDDAEREDEPLRIDAAEREHILRILESCGGRKQEAARILGINKTTLWRKMKRYGLPPE
jgi:DNA-binding NtrC family response regulator